MTMMRGTLRLALLVAFVLAAVLNAVTAASTENTLAGECSALQAFSCPNCGGINVTDCLTQCDSYRSTDKTNNICFSRKLFNAGPHAKDPSNPDTYYNYLWNDIVGTFVWFLAAGVATACGVGGGGIYVPLGMLLLQFAPKAASGLSQASIFGASLGGLIINLRAKHPNERIKDSPGVTDEEGNVLLPPDDDDEEEAAEGAPRFSVNSGRRNFTRPLIDYDMALFLAPMEMAGAVLGLLAQQLMPNWLYLLIASVILGFTSYKTYKKFFATRKKEIDARRKADELQALRDEVHGAENGDNKTGSPSESLANEPTAETLGSDSGALLSNTSSLATGAVDANGELNLATNGVEHLPDGKQETDSATDVKEKSLTDGSADDNGEERPEEPVLTMDPEDELLLRRKYLEEDARQYPREKLLALVLLWIGLSLLTFLKGGKGVDSLVGISCESPWYGVLIAFQFLWTLGFALFYGLKLLKRQVQKDAVRYPYQPHDVLWDYPKLRFYSFFTFVAGIVAGLIGIGGGMVLGPLMLVMNIHPRVSTATTATMIVLTSSSVAIMFVTSGVVPWSYAIYFFCICLVGALVGKTYIDGYVKRTGKASLLICILATIIALATLGCLVIVFLGLSQNGWCLTGFKQFCYVSNKDEAACPESLDEHRLLGYNPQFYADVIVGAGSV